MVRDKETAIGSSKREGEGGRKHQHTSDRNDAGHRPKSGPTCRRPHVSSVFNVLQRRRALKVLQHDDDDDDDGITPAAVALMTTVNVAIDLETLFSAEWSTL